MARRSSSPPIFNIPPMVVILFGLLVAIHLIISLLEPQALEDTTFLFAFFTVRYGGVEAFSEQLYQLPGGTLASFWTPITYMFLHANWMHLIFNALWLLVFGTLVARILSNGAFLFLTVLCTLGAAAMHLLTHYTEASLMIGASGAVSGYMGASLRIMFVKRRGVFPSPILATLLDPRALIMCFIWLVFPIILEFTPFSLFPGEGNVAWDAHIGGFIVGLLLIGPLSKFR